MPIVNAHDVHLVRVLPDNCEPRLWAAATSREDAVDRVLNAIPEGWTARLLDEPSGPYADALQDIMSGEVRELI